MYTAIYPGSLPYVPAWWLSVEQQVDTAFDLWISLDGVEQTAVSSLLGRSGLNIKYLKASENETPADVRRKAIELMVESYSAVVFVDSDDILLPTRTAGARAGLEHSDAVASAMEVIGTTGEPLGTFFNAPAGVDIAKLLITNNIFGLSNTAYTTEALRRCLPIPSRCRLVDWFLAVRALQEGFRLTFDPIPRMKYRQYESNTARIIPPFTGREVMVASKLVLGHYDCVLAASIEKGHNLLNDLQAARSRLVEFIDVISGKPEVLVAYVNALNQLDDQHIWWSLVANPRLEAIWNHSQ